MIWALIGGIAIGSGVTALVFGWLFYWRLNGLRPIPGLYPVAGPPDPATVSDDSDELLDGADCPGCAAGSLWPRSHDRAPYVSRECRQPDSNAV